MAEFRAARTMPAEAEIVFDVAADIERSGRWLPATLDVQPDGPGRVHVVEDDGDGHRDAEGLIRVRPEQLRVEWGSEDSPDYAGWLQVAHADSGTSEATLHLSLLGDREKEHLGEAADRLQAGMQDALRRLAEEVDRRVNDAG